MKKYLLATVAIIGMAIPALADTAQPMSGTTIAVGQAGRGYEGFGIKVAKRLEGKLPTTVVNYEGSDDISRAVCDGSAGIGIMQIDAIYARQKEGCKLRVVGTYGTEYAYLMVPPDSPYDELSDMGAGNKILVDTIGSGTDLFWHTIISIDTGENGNSSGWSKVTSVNDPVFLAASMADMGDIDAVLIVAKPDSKDVKELLDAGWELAAINDKDINDELFNSESLYPREEAEIAGTGGFFSGNTANTSYAIRSYVVVGEDVAANRRAFADVAQAVKSVKAEN